MENKTSTAKKYWGLGIAGLVLVVLAGAFLSIRAGFPAFIKSAYQGRDCKNTIKYADIYAQVGGDLASTGVNALKSECQFYQGLQKLEDQQKWQAAFDGYQKYLHDYPQGLMAAEAAERSITALTNLAQEQTRSKNFDTANRTFEHALEISVADGQRSLLLDGIAKNYIDWAASLRAAGDFSTSENKLVEFQDWARSANFPTGPEMAQKEIAQTYLDWGVFWEDAGDDISAIRKFKHVLAIAPQTDVSTAANQHLAGIYLRRADDLLKQGYFEAGITQYRFGLEFSSPAEQVVLNDTIANTYLGWAKSFKEKGDFLSAIQKTTQALKIPASSGVQSIIGEAQKEMVQSFSNSTGDQATKALRDTAEAICANGGKPELPIFGLDPAQHQAVFQGLELKFSEKLFATTPASAHYVVCMAERAVVLQSIKLLFVPIVVKTSVPDRHIPQATNTIYVYMSHTHKVLTRTQYFWDVTIFDLTTAEKVAQKTFNGTLPERILYKDGDNIHVHPNTGLTFDGILIDSTRGEKPVVADVNEWLLTYIK